MTDQIEARAALVAARVHAWYSERPIYLWSELKSRAFADHIDISQWIDHPTVRATGLKGVGAQIHAGSPADFFVLQPPELGPHPAPKPGALTFRSEEESPCRPTKGE
jgi:hypothetical protein